MALFYYDIEPYKESEMELEERDMKAIVKGESNDRNTFGELYTIKELDDSLIYKESVIIGIFSVFCSFSAQTG